jgi:CBS domain-containing protein
VASRLQRLPVITTLMGLVTVEATASLREAVSLMVQHRVDVLQVVDAHGLHVGHLHISNVVAP